MTFEFTAAPIALDSARSGLERKSVSHDGFIHTKRFVRLAREGKLIVANKADKYGKDAYISDKPGADLLNQFATTV